MSTNYKQGRWKKNVKDATKYYITLCRRAVGKGKSIPIGKNPEQNRVDPFSTRVQIM